MSENNVLQPRGSGVASASYPALIAVFGLVVLLYALVMFSPLWRPGAILFNTDDNVGSLTDRRAAMPESFWRGWHDRTFLGARAPDIPTWTNLLIWALPTRWVHNWIYAAHLTLASVFLALFLRRRGIGPAGWAVAALTAFWLGSTFTLVYAGHLGKFGVVLFAALFLWRAEIAATTRRGVAARAALAGGALGAMFLEQSDVALLFAVALGPYLLHRLYAVWGWDARQWARRLIPVLGVSLLIAFHPLWTGYSAFVRGTTAAQSDRNEQWEFITQWSWPPEETIDFIAPGFMGWRSDEPAGPYCGRMGRSRGWESGRGVMNFKLENQYIGILPLALAIAAIALARRKSEADALSPNRRGETFFWTAVAAATFLLALGKFTPLYDIVLRIPALSAIRGPVKWLQPFQFAVGILAAFASDRFWPLNGNRAPVGPPRGLAIGLLSLAGLLGLIGLGLWVGRAAAASRLAGAGWGEWGEVIARTRAVAALHGAGLALVAGLLLWPRADGRSTVPGSLCAVLVPLLMAADARWLSRHYVQRLPPSLIADNAVTRILNEEMGPDRAALVTPAGFYGAWLTFLFPYQQIRVLNFTQMPRMPAEVRAFLERVAGDPVRYWRLSGVRHILAPPAVWAEIQRDSTRRDQFSLRLAFEPLPAPDGEGITVRESDANAPAAHVLLRLQPPQARFAIVTRWRTLDDNAALAALGDPGRPPLEEALLSPEAGVPDGAFEPSPENSVEVISTRPGRNELVVTAASPVCVRIADRYDPYWRVSINGQPGAVLRADYLFQAVLVPAGRHHVILEYSPPHFSLGVLGVGLFLCLASGVYLGLGRVNAGESS